MSDYDLEKGVKIIGRRSAEPSPYSPVDPIFDLSCLYLPAAFTCSISAEVVVRRLTPLFLRPQSIL